MGSAAKDQWRVDMEALGFFVGNVPAKYRAFWDEKLSEGERCVILESASIPSVRPNRPLDSYGVDLQQKIISQINRAIAWGEMLKGALL